MMRRVGWWAMAGFGVAAVWVALVWALWPRVNVGQSWVVAVTAPASMLGRRRRMSWEEFLLLNAGVYAVAGVVVEGVRAVVRRVRG